MADVRALLRAEQAARAQSSGSAAQSSAARKRKAPTEDVQTTQKRSRPDPTTKPSSDAQGAAAKPTRDASPPAAASPGAVIESEFIDAGPGSSSLSSQPQAAAVDEDEWAAFERDMATPPPSPPRQTAINALQSHAAISAAPKTRQEIEAQEKTSLKQQRALKEEDIKAEREDAARQLEDEFEEMEALEARVQRLKQMRESIRTRKEVVEDAPEAAEAVEVSIGDDMPLDADDSAEDSDEDYDDWGFGKS
jgi:hypothetical protein